MGMEQMWLNPIRFTREEPEYFGFIWNTVMYRTPTIARAPKAFKALTMKKLIQSIAKYKAPLQWGERNWD